MKGFKRPRGENVWQLIVTVPRGDGRSRQISRTFHGTQRQADSALARLVTEVEDGKHARQAGGTVEQLVREWFTVANYEPSTLAVADRLLKDYIVPWIGKKRVRTLKPRDLTAFYQQLRNGGGRDGAPLKLSTVRRVHIFVRRALAYGVHLEWCATNPAEAAHLPREDAPAPAQPPTPGELARLFAAASDDPSWHAFLRLAATSGARRGELCALRWSRVDLTAGTVVIARAIGQSTGGTYEKGTKTRQPRTVLLGAATLEVMRDHYRRAAAIAEECETRLGADAFVFSNDPQGLTYWTPAAVTTRFIRTRKTAGLRSFRFHDLRHFVGTYLIDAGMPVSAVQAHLGHDRASTTTDIYGHLVDARLRTTADTIDQLLSTVTTESD